MNIEKHTGTTNVEGHTFSYKWIIKNFHMCDQATGESFSSPSFRTSKYPNIEWFLNIYPRGEKKESEGYISIFLMTKSKDNFKVKAIFKFEIIDLQIDHHRFIAQAAHTFSEKGNGLGFGQFIRRDILLPPLVRKVLLNNQLTILCTITIGGQIENVLKEILDVFDGDENKYLLPKELSSLLEEKQLTDVTLVVSGKHLQAHKAVLAARSPVFLAMLQNNMKERANGKIELTDVSFNVLTEVLQYMYTDDVKNIKEYSQELVRFADKYDMKGLKLICEKYIYNELSITNAVGTLITAESYNCEILKSHVLKFILKHAKEIVKTNQFATLKKDLPSLVVDMINAQTCL